jgi:membrane-bound lytic murein transglycosylase D
LSDSLDTLQHERFINVIENSLNAYYEENASTSFQTDSIIKALGYEENEVPSFPDSVYCERLAEMNEMSPFHLDCNEDVLSVINFFAQKRRGFTSITLGRSKLYFTMFEEKLAEQNMPLELKYLSVIESGLRPQVKSRAGAMGLWQFMYRTGKMYGLNQNSYIDERMDPELATEAACKYLKQLYNMYDDWNMALAAYNAGPGNVNKAIRRSGGKMTYWEIRPFLPRETQGYVPNFIAMSYMMTYYAEHNIRPREPKVYDFHLDTVCLRDGLHMNVIDSLIGWSEEDIIMVNPIYKTSYIPKTDPPQCIKIPHDYLSEWIAMEDSIYALDSLIYEMIVEEEEAEQTTIIHYVRRGQNLGFIAGQYGTTVRNIMDWNNLRSTRLSIGQRLTIYTNNPKPKETQKSSAQNEKPKEAFKTPTKGTLYAIKSGDNLWTIAKNYQTSVDELRRLNPGIDSSDLKIGQKIRIK